MYVCTELDESSAYGDGFAYSGGHVVHCKSWQELPNQPNLSRLTQEQADQITVSVLSVIFLAFGWFLIIKFLRKFK